MRNSSFFKIILIAISVVFLSSCDKDFNSIGDDLVGDDHFGLEGMTHDVLSYNQKTGPVQSNNLPVNALGVYEDAVFGTTKADFVTQVTLSSVNPVVDMSLNPVIDNVILSVPYFSHVTATDATTGANTYVLDSIYGPETGKIKLSVYENGYFMRDLDPSTAFLEPQKYYSNQSSDFENLKKPIRLNDGAIAENDEFFFDNKEFEVKTTVDSKETITRTPPAMRLSLNKDYFKTRIIDAVAAGKLITNDVFKNYFRGLYFKVEKSGSNSARLAMMNFKAGTVTVNFKEDGVEVVKNADGTTTNKPIRVDRSIVLNLTGNTVSLLSNTNQPSYDTAITNPNSTAGDSRLYLRGGEGSMAVLELFNKTDVRGYNTDGNPTVGGNGVSDELEDLKELAIKKKLLINEANLVFHLDATTMGLNKIPNRIYLYDLTNSAPVLDYLYDGTAVANAKTGHLIYSGILNPTNTSDKTYKIRLTSQIRNLVKNRDAANVKLGVVITEDVNNITMNNLRSSLTLPGGTILTKVPQASVMSPSGVVLFGSNITAGDKRLKFEIYYTKPN
ncbi:DUF4270 domain-containing protein [Flavobacterium undicola]|uniref:DUF4270 domain-containing protein n=1 Tax=Flavobacterium undicola TaxID=1932779 RepID=UPI0013783A81|nr:DUF4270 domain-containing protein [Flavobacterium undicola]MBA0885087.1 DUF4270 domain-containing protein [Flavobacterium undicola]